MKWKMLTCTVSVDFEQSVQELTDIDEIRDLFMLCHRLADQHGTFRKEGWMEGRRKQVKAAPYCHPPLST